MSELYDVRGKRDQPIFDFRLPIFEFKNKRIPALTFGAIGIWKLAF